MQIHDNRWKGGKGAVYTITNRANGKVYVGSTKQWATGRFAVHRHSLRHGKHSNSVLQADWQEHGEGMFVFARLEVVPNPLHLLAFEQSYLDYYRRRPAGVYNAGTVVEATHGHRQSVETRARKSIAHTGRKRSDAEMAGFRRANEATKRKVVCAMPGTFTPLKIYESVHAVKADGFSQSNVTSALKGRLKTSGGLHWFYLDDVLKVET